MEQRKIETFDTGLGKIDAHKVTDLEHNSEGKLIPRITIEVYPHGISEPGEMTAWFGSVLSFAEWMGETKHNF